MGKGRGKERERREGNSIAWHCIAQHSKTKESIGFPNKGSPNSNWGNAGIIFYYFSHLSINFVCFFVFRFCF